MSNNTLILKFSSMLLTGGWCATLLGMFPKQYWLFDYFSHFPLQYFVGLSILAFFYTTHRRYHLAVASTLAALINLLILSPSLLTNSEVRQHYHDSTIRIMSINISVTNSRLDALQSVILEQSPHIILIYEITSSQTNNLKELLSQYPYQHIDARETSFGIAALSRIPLTSVTTLNLIDEYVPAIEADFIHNDYSIRVIGVHLYAPFSRKMLEDRDRQLQALATWLQKNKRDRVLIIGDMNTTSYSHGFKKFISQTSLSSSIDLFGLYSSWPSLLGPFGIAIDHALTTDTLQITQQLITHIPGSDHRAVTVDLIAQ